MPKKIISLILICFMLLLSSCAASPGTTQNTAQNTVQNTTQNTVQSTAATTEQTAAATTAEPQIPASSFIVDNSSSRGLYYLDYTEDYKFDEFVSGGGAKSTLELVEYAYKAFPNIKLNLSSLGYGCSSFCAQSTEGDVIFGRNFDMDAQNSGSYLIVHTKPENGYESYSTVNLKFLGITAPSEPADDTSPLLLAPYIPLDGINSEGLAICVLQLNFPEIHASGSGVNMTSTTIIRNVLDNAKNIEEAIEIFQSCNVHTDGYAYHYMLGDASGKSAVIEFVDNEMVVSYKSSDIQVCANTYVTEEGIAFYKDSSSADSLNRMNAISSSVKNSSFDLTAENAFKALKAGSNSYTRWSIVYNLTDRTMVISINRKFDKMYFYSFEK